MGPPAQQFFVAAKAHLHTGRVEIRTTAKAQLYFQLLLSTTQCTDNCRKRVSLWIHSHDGAAVRELLAHDDIALLQQSCGWADVCGWGNTSEATKGLEYSGIPDPSAVHKRLCAHETHTRPNIYITSAKTLY